MCGHSTVFLQLEQCAYAFLHLCRRAGAGSMDPMGACSIIKKQVERKRTESLRKAAINHQKYVRGTTMYPLEHNPEHGMLCTVPS